jgi:DNA transposition AAA+ family ATPase
MKLKIKSNKISKRKLNALKKACSGNMLYVADMAGCSQSTVYRVLNGDISNERVIVAAIETADLLDIRLKELL